MPVFLARDNLSRGDLQLSLSNGNGYAQDAASVKWTVYSKDGEQVSGKSLPAIHQTTGVYYASWYTDVPTGSYKVEWEVIQEFGGPTVRLTDYAFVVDPSSYPCGQITNPNTIPASGYSTFLSGQALGPNDLSLYLKNDSGFLQNAYAVFFSILDAVGNHSMSRLPATNFGMGSYYASFVVGLCSGNYTIVWEWQTDPTTPIKSARVGFGVVNPAAPYSIVIPILCASSLFSSCQMVAQPILARMLVSQCDSGSCSCKSYQPMSCPSFPHVLPPTPPQPSHCCCEVEIPRTIHLPYGRLPSTGEFTSQTKYLIPEGVHKIAFYITYAYGAPGGYVLLKILWGNGTEETPQTLVDFDITIIQPNSLQNMLVQNLEGPIPQNVDPISFLVEANVPGGATTVRLIAAEGGIPGIPGCLGITLTASSE